MWINNKCDYRYFVSINMKEALFISTDCVHSMLHVAHKWQMSLLIFSKHVLTRTHNNKWRHRISLTFSLYIFFKANFFYDQMLLSINIKVHWNAD